MYIDYYRKEKAIKIILDIINDEGISANRV